MKRIAAGLALVLALAAFGDTLAQGADPADGQASRSPIESLVATSEAYLWQAQRFLYVTPTFP